MSTFTFNGSMRRVTADAETVQTKHGKVYASPGQWIVSSDDGEMVAILSPEATTLIEDKPAPKPAKK